MSLVSRTAKSLLTSAWDALDEKPGRSLIAPGAEVAWDDCCDGQLAVRIVSSEPVWSRAQRCIVAVRVTYGVSIVRCVRTVSDRGKPPTQEEITADGLGLVDDMCALYAMLVDFEAGHQRTIGAWTPSGPSGGCAGGEWSVSVDL